jgi:hypothetical protein
MDEGGVGIILMSDSMFVGGVLAKGSVHAFGKLSENARNFASPAFSTGTRRTGQQS